MVSTEEQLTHIGFTAPRVEPVCWRVERLAATDFGEPEARPAAEPPCSRDLLYWRDRLARSPRPSPYRITRIANAGRPPGSTKP